jgi:hypothetical protein
MDPVSIIGYISLGIGSLLAIFSRIPKQTIANYKDLVATIEKQRIADKEESDKRIKALEDQKEEDRKQHIEQVKAIAELQGQIKVYKELPLQDMALAMKTMAKASEVNAEYSQQILETLQKSAVIAAEDKLETHTETTIKTVNKG